MFTPQQIEQVSFGKATFGGYNMEDVDAFLEPLTDYIARYSYDMTVWIDNVLANCSDW